MSKRRGKNRYKESRYNKSKKSNENNSKKFGAEIKVVSTNITKEEVKENQIKNEAPAKKKSENYNKSQREELKSNQTSSKKIYNDNKNLLPYQLSPLNKEICSICQKMIDDMPNAIISQKDNKFYHFNCVISILSMENTLEQRQRLVYLGSGAFGIIENPANDSSSKFIIKKKIQFILDK